MTTPNRVGAQLFAGMMIFLVACNGDVTSIDDDGIQIDEDEITILVRDTFNRTATSGWGWPDVGPAWFPGQQNAADFSVEGGSGLITKFDSGTRNVIARTAKSSDGYGLNVRGIASFRIDTDVDDASAFYTVQVYGRRDDRDLDGQNYFRYRVRTFGHGRMDVRLEQSLEYNRSWLTDNIIIPTVWAVGQKYWLRWEAIGTSPATRVRLRVWQDGTPEPSTWSAAATVNEPALDVIGTTGFRVSGPSAGQTTFPVVFALDDLEYVEID
jgi:hypothetical protein